jgi:hypothetical protein
LSAYEFGITRRATKILCSGREGNFPNAAFPHCAESIAGHSPASISLAFLAFRTSHVIAVITAQGEKMTSTIEQTETPETKAAKKAAAGARRANVVSGKGKARKNATPRKKARMSV